MSVNDFIDSLSCSEGDPVREWVRAIADLTVRLRVGYTSQDRPDGDPLCGNRGKSIPRVGTGWICDVDSEINEPCPCVYCDGHKVRKYWRFRVETAQHVVYDTEEAKRTRLDLFYDDETSRQDGKVVTVWALRVVRSYTENDRCRMECVTHDERIGEMVESLYRRWDSLTEGIRSRPIYSKKSSLLDRLREAEATRSRSRPIYSKKSSLLDLLREAVATRSRSRPIYFKKSSLLDRLREAVATRSRSRPIYSMKSSLLDRLREAVATRSRPIYSMKSSLLDRLREAEATRSRSRPIYSKKSSLLDRLREAVATRSRPIYSMKSSLLDRLREAVATRSRPIYSMKSSLLDRLREAVATRSRPIYSMKSSLLDRLREAVATRSKPIYSMKSQYYTLIISHPHGQAKKITLGKLRYTVKGGNSGYREYETATCPGSSGAPVFMLYTKGDDVFLHHGYLGYIHSGTQSSSVSTDQINYGHWDFVPLKR